MSGDVRVKVSVEHLRSDIADYLTADAAEKAKVIADAVAAALDDYDITAAVQRIAHQELDKFVRDATAVYFRDLLKSSDAHRVIRDALAQRIEGNQ